MSFGLYGMGVCDSDRRTSLWPAPSAYATHWIVLGAVVLLGVGILTGVKATRQKDPVG
jgi:hypothetical protein